MAQKRNQRRRKNDEFRQILLTFDLKVRVKVPILISLKS